MSAGPFVHSRLRFRQLLVSLPILIVIGCASELEKQKNLESGHLLTVALENLADRYIEPLRPGAMSINGLRKLVAVDSALSIDQNEHSIALSVDGTTAIQHTIPEDTDLHGWADITVQLVNKARSQSTAVGELSEAETHKLLLTGIIENTDKYSRYLPPEAAGRSRVTRDGFGGIGVVLDQRNDRVISVESRLTTQQKKLV